VLAVLSTKRRCGRGLPGFCALFTTLYSLISPPARADTCSSTTGLTPCFDANSLWLPAGRTTFVSLPSTRVNAVGQLNLGFATELLHGPVLLHVASPDSAGRDVHVVDDALDASLFFAIGALRNLELSVVLPTRLYQNGAGAGGVSSQSAPSVEQSALRDPRLGVAYSFDQVLAHPGLGLRAALDASLPLGDKAAFAGERSVVLMPTATFGWQSGRVALRSSLGARLRSAVDFGDVRLGNEAFVGLGVSVDALSPGLLSFSLEGYGLPPLTSSRANTANASLTEVTLFPAEWLVAAQTSFSALSEWSLSGSFGTGIPVSSETRSAGSASSTSYFLGVTEPAWRTILTVRFTPK
jgi:hypothetical protein